MGIGDNDESASERPTSVGKKRTGSVDNGGCQGGIQQCDTVYDGDAAQDREADHVSHCFFFIHPPAPQLET